MAKSVSLELFKKSIMADDLMAADEVLQFKLDSAEDSVIRATHRTYAELCEMTEDGTFPNPLREAIITLAAYNYEKDYQPDTQSVNGICGAVNAMIKPYRKLAE